MKHYRHGDLLIVEVSSIPSEAEHMDQHNRVLAYGEVTGHKHQLDLGDMFETKDGKLYFKLPENGKLSHEEHNTIVLPPGKYEVRRQREYSPEMVRPVAD